MGISKHFDGSSMAHSIAPDVPAPRESRPVPSERSRGVYRAALPITSEHVSRVRSAAKRWSRKRSRELIRDALQAERASALDFADAVEVSERAARKALEIDENAAVIDVGEMLNMARTGAGGARLARRVLTMLLREIDSIEFSH
jgi:hypothetical protein